MKPETAQVPKVNDRGADTFGMSGAAIARPSPNHCSVAGRCRKCGLRFSIQDDLCEDCWQPDKQPNVSNDVSEGSEAE